MPDPFKFNVNFITGMIKVESGGEFILVTADPNSKLDLHPLIGTEYTATLGAPIGADFVMNPAKIKPESWIEVRFSGKGNPIPALELTGEATALGRLILDKAYKQNNSNYDRREPPFRFEVWLTYPFTVTKNGTLLVGNLAEEPNLHSSLQVTGMNCPIAGINKGVLTNNGQVKVNKKNAIVEWFGGYFNHNVQVFDPTAPLDARVVLGYFYKNNSAVNTITNNSSTVPKIDVSVDVRVWSPEWLGSDIGNNPDPPPYWWPTGLGP